MPFAVERATAAADEAWLGLGGLAVHGNDDRAAATDFKAAAQPDTQLAGLLYGQAASDVFRVSPVCND